MTYFGFLAVFLVLPIVLFGTWQFWWRTRTTRETHWQLGKLSGAIILLHVVIALIYTTPWDNYLVATGVWWYDPALVTGLTIGWVPIEEYTFFILQPIFSSLLLLTLQQWLLPAPSMIDVSRARWLSLLPAGILWLMSVYILVSGWQPGTYLALELGWALPPIMLQLFFGADILWRYRRAVLVGVFGPTIYLAAADALAIGAGIWTINPAQSLHLLIGGVLPVEEFIFFLLTNTLIVFGVTLSIAPESRQRFQTIREAISARAQSANRRVGRSTGV